MNLFKFAVFLFVFSAAIASTRTIHGEQQEQEMSGGFPGQRVYNYTKG